MLSTEASRSCWDAVSRLHRLQQSSLYIPACSSSTSGKLHTWQPFRQTLSDLTLQPSRSRCSGPCSWLRRRAPWWAASRWSRPPSRWHASQPSCPAFLLCGCAPLLTLACRADACHCFQALSGLTYPAGSVLTVLLVYLSHSSHGMIWDIWRAVSCWATAMALQVVHTGKHVEGQIYLPEINWGLCLLGIAAIAGFRSTVQIGYAFSERSAPLWCLHTISQTSLCTVSKAVVNSCIA